MLDTQCSKYCKKNPKKIFPLKIIPLVSDDPESQTDWFCKERPKGRLPGKVHRVKSYCLPRGTAHLYNEGDLHSSRREKEVRMIRVEGINLLKVRRQKYQEAV